MPESAEGKYIPSVQEMIIIACRAHGIAPEIPLAIARLETGNFTSAAFIECNNVGGMSVDEVPITYDSLEDGVDAFVKNLADNYFGQGLDTVEAISCKYCPVNASEWAKVVNELLKKQRFLIVKEENQCQTKKERTTQKAPN